MCLGWAEAAVGVPVSDVEVRLGSDARSGHTTEVGWGGNRHHHSSPNND